MFALADGRRDVAAGLPPRRRRDQVANGTVGQARLDAGDDHLAGRVERILGADVVAELGGLPDTVAHVLAALGVVHGSGLVGDGAAHHPAAQRVEQAGVAAASLVEGVAGGDAAGVVPRRQLASLLDERDEVGGQAVRQGLTVVDPRAEQGVELVDAADALLPEEAVDDSIGGVVPHLIGRQGVEVAAGDRALRAPRPCRPHREDAHHAQRAAAQQHLPPRDLHVRPPVIRPSGSGRPLHLVW